MRLLIWILALIVACGDPKEETGLETDTDTDTDTDADTDADTDTDTDEDPHEIGRLMPPFALEDINPASASYTRVIDSADLAGTPFALVFLDSRCLTCVEVAVDVWAEYEAHPEWHDALPIMAVQSVGGMLAPETVPAMLEGHAMPYLADTEDVALWPSYYALNHDFFVVSAEGTLEAWLPLYSWPDDLALFSAFMDERLGR